MSDVIIAQIEIGKGSRVKYEWLEEQKTLLAKRILPAGYIYPVNYGFIPDTLAPDEDALDIIVFASETLQPGALVECRILGVLEMLDKGVRDDKILAVMADDSSWPYPGELDSYPSSILEEIHLFYQEVKRLEKKSFKFLGIKSKEVALKLIDRSKKW